MSFYKKKLPIIFLTLFFFIGSYFSIQTGITHDEAHEQEVWEYNVNAVKSIYNKNDDYQNLQNYRYKYYGIGFQIFSQPVQIPIKFLIKKYSNIDNLGAHLLSKHFAIFLLFCLSGVFFFLIIKKITNDKNFSYLATILYLLYPYLLGHGFYNPKDSPFSSIWLICTYFSFRLSDDFLDKDKLKIFNILMLSFFTSLLISVRIAGILIFIQYLITFLILIELKKESVFYYIKKYLKKIFLFLTLTLFLVYLSYPVFWKNPLQIIDSILFMGRFPDATGCTMLFGKCVPAQKLDITYIPSWILIKLPLIILIGLILIPFSEKKIFIINKNKIFFGTIFISVLVFPILLIVNKVVLYDDIRQILFLVPLLFILGITSIYFFSKKISIFLTLFFITFFLYENIKIYPYQYSWLNIPSRLVDINKNFDSDYWSVSGKNMANYISKKENKYNNDICIFGWPQHSFKPFLNQKKFLCFKPDSELHKKNIRPFIGIQIGRNLRRGIPNGCSIEHKESFKLLFHSDEIITGKLLYCK